MNSLVYRFAKITDAPALSAMARQSFCETFSHYEPAGLEQFLNEYYSVQAYTAHLAETGTIFELALSDDTIVGYAKYGNYQLPLTPSIAPAFELHRLYVLKAWHGHRIGAELFKRFMEAGRTSGAKALYLGVWEGNENAQSFYAHYGFSKIGTYLYPPIGNVVDREWIMSKPLAA